MCEKFLDLGVREDIFCNAVRRQVAVYGGPFKKVDILQKPRSQLAVAIGRGIQVRFLLPICLLQNGACMGDWCFHHQTGLLKKERLHFPHSFFAVSAEDEFEDSLSIVDDAQPYLHALGYLRNADKNRTAPKAVNGAQERIRIRFSRRCDRKGRLPPGV